MADEYRIKVYGDRGYNRVARVVSPEYIVIHYTADGVPDSDTAYRSMLYFGRANRNASAHYFIDNYDIWQFEDPAIWACWHVGDGHGAYGITNQNSIGIEIVQDGNDPFSNEEIRKAHWLVHGLMQRFGIDADHVVRHYDASRKLCPWYYTPGGAGGDAAWWALHAILTSPWEGEVDIPDEDNAIYRLYNYITGAHHFTGDVNEARSLQSLGWKYEGIAWYTGDSGKAVYRVYNPYTGDHLFTASISEVKTLSSVGWHGEGLAWLSDGSIPVYRLFNPYASMGAHHYTADAAERSEMVRDGWIVEGESFRVQKLG